MKKRVFTISDVHVPTEEELEDISEFWALKPTVADILPGSNSTEHKAACSLTSSYAEIATKTIIKYNTYYICFINK